MLKLKLQYFGHLMKRANSLKWPWCWERLKAEREGDDRGWDGWVASPTQWIWVWVNSGSWLWTGRPGMLQPMRSQRVGHDWATELNWTGLYNPWYSPGQSTGVCRCSLLQGIFPTQGSNPGIPHWRQILYQLSHQGSSQPVFYYKTDVNFLQGRNINNLRNLHIKEISISVSVRDEKLYHKRIFSREKATTYIFSW